MNCLFCDIIAKKIPAFIIYENDKTLAFLDIFPNSEGHVLVIPKKHSSDFTSVSLEDAVEVVKTKKHILSILQAALNPTGFNFLSNQGAIANQMVFHYHEHIIPKYNESFGYSPEKIQNKSDRSAEEIFNIIKKTKTGN